VFVHIDWAHKHGPHAGVGPFEKSRALSMLIQSRRRFLTNAAFAGVARFGEFGAWGMALAAAPPPEIGGIDQDQLEHDYHRTHGLALPQRLKRDLKA